MFIAQRTSSELSASEFQHGILLVGEREERLIFSHFFLEGEGLEALERRGRVIFASIPPFRLPRVQSTPRADKGGVEYI